MSDSDEYAYDAEYITAIKTGNLELLKVMHLRKPLPRLTCALAAEHNQMGVLQWCESFIPLNEDVCVQAAHSGHLHILQWARSRTPPCPWNDIACFGAIYGGQLDVLQWLRAQDPPCPWKINDVCMWAALYCKLHILQWLRSLDPPCPLDIGYIIHSTSVKDLDILLWIICHECEKLPMLINTGSYYSMVCLVHSLLAAEILENIYLTDMDSDVVPKDIVLLIGGYIGVDKVMFDRTAKINACNLIKKNWRRLTPQLVSWLDTFV